MAGETGIVPKCLPSFCERRQIMMSSNLGFPVHPPGKPETHCMEKPELFLKVCPSGDPLLRGYCSACLDTTFVFAVNTEENQRLMQQAFDIHVQEVHILVDLAGAERPAEAAEFLRRGMNIRLGHGA